MTQRNPVSTYPGELIPLSSFSPLIKAFFDLPDDEFVSQAPFVWWDRSKRNGSISVPIPEPLMDMYVGNRGPIFTQEQVIHWYGAWKDLTVRVCVEAGDTVDGDGNTVPSSQRAIYSGVSP